MYIVPGTYLRALDTEWLFYSTGKYSLKCYLALGFLFRFEGKTRKKDEEPLAPLSSVDLLISG